MDYAAHNLTLCNLALYVSEWQIQGASRKGFVNLCINIRWHFVYI